MNAEKIITKSLSRQIQRPIRAIDLFCGAGGSSYGARQAGVEIVAAFDIWPPAVDTYNANFGEGRARCADVFDLDHHALLAELGKIDLILASPECTNHSKAKGKGTRCERSRETALEVLRFAEVFRPQWIVIENVLEMQQWSRHQELQNGLTDLDYGWIEEEINAKDLGVPQSRKRLFFICSYQSEPSKVKRPEVKPKTAKDIISNTYQLSPLRTKNRAKATLAKADYAIEQIQKGKGELEPFLIVYYGSAKEGGNGGWQSLDKPLRTITTVDRFGYVVPGKDRDEDKMRMLQPDELKRAMGYENDFRFANDVTRRDKIKLMGNGVCPPVMEAIVRSLLETCPDQVQFAC
jgi:DNA (cytosine-5)-methyltransferase 1